MRGEHWSVTAWMYSVGGSSPHARGAPELRRWRQRRHGIIPACAGSTTCVLGDALAERDHPRMRGEHSMFPRETPRTRGSSPHARGAPTSREDAVARQGIIPACAGSTSGRRGHLPPTRDHPRMRGEHSCTTSRDVPILGSSPHARGALRRWRDFMRPRGIIPACAGST